MSARDLQNLLDDHLADWSLPGRSYVHRVLSHIARCRTPAAGTHRLHCLNCDHHEVINNSCRDRHCPICQGVERQRWVRAREDELLPVPHFHVVCTLPHDFLPLVRSNRELMYGLLMDATRQAIDDLARNPKHLGAQVGQISVLHTWGGPLRLHPHVHTIVTGGGLDDSGSWVPCTYNRKNKNPFLVSVRVLRRHFRTVMIQKIQRAFDQGLFDDPTLAGFLPEISTAARFRGFLTKMRAKRWVVYIKRPFGDDRQCVRYLGRYTYRVGLTPCNLSAYDGQHITLTWKDTNDHHRLRQTRFTAHGFLKAFAQHILPPRFRRVRMSGLFAPNVRKKNLARAREALSRSQKTTSNELQSSEVANLTAEKATNLCPECGQPTYFVASVTVPTKDGTRSYEPKLYHEKRIDRLFEQLDDGEQDLFGIAEMLAKDKSNEESLPQEAVLAS